MVILTLLPQVLNTSTNNSALKDIQKSLNIIRTEIEKVDYETKIVKQQALQTTKPTELKN